MEERRGTTPDRFARLAGRGREGTTPIAAHMLAAGAVGILVLVILTISFVLWLVLR